MFDFEWVCNFTKNVKQIQLFSNKFSMTWWRPPGRCPDYMKSERVSMKFQVFQFFLNLDDFWSYFNGFAGCLEPLVPWPLFWFTKRFRNVHLQIYLKSQGLLRKHSFFTFSNFFNFLSKSNGFPRCLHFDAPWPLFLFFECLGNTSFQFCFELMTS